MQRRVALLSLIALAPLAGCGSDVAPAPPTSISTPRPAPADALEAALRAREETDAYALTPYEAPFRASLEEGERASFTSVLAEGFCYKLLGQGDDGVRDLDLLLYDPNGSLAQLDAREGATPTLGSERPICPVEPGIHRVEVRMTRGHGAVLAQWYANQSL